MQEQCGGTVSELPPYVNGQRRKLCRAELAGAGRISGENKGIAICGRETVCQRDTKRTIKGRRAGECFVAELRAGIQSAKRYLELVGRCGGVGSGNFQRS